MRRIDEQQTNSSMLMSGRSWQVILGALLWIGGGILALLMLILLGPALVTYVTAADLPIAVLAPLVSTIIAGWDVGGLLLIMLGCRRLMTA